MQLPGDASFGFRRGEVSQLPIFGQDLVAVDLEAGAYRVFVDHGFLLRPGGISLCPAIRVIFGSMGSKDKGKRETKKAPKPKPKVEPGRKRGEDTRLGGPPKS
jgi:hypothetical protein